MELQLTVSEFSALTATTRAIAIGQRAAEIGYGVIATAVAATREFGPGLFETACVYTLAAGIVTRRFYDAQLRQHVESAAYVTLLCVAIAFLCTASAVSAGYQAIAPIVRRQWAVQVDDWKQFHAAVATPTDRGSGRLEGGVAHM